MKRISFLYLLMGIVALDVVLGLCFNEQSDNHFPPSVITAGYGPERQGVMRSHLKLYNGIILAEKYLNLPTDTTSGMPLFINSNDLSNSIKIKQPSARGQYLVIATKSGELILFDLERMQEYWSIKVMNPIISNSIVIGLSWGKLYFRDDTRHYSINIDGSDLQTVKFDYKQLVAKQLNIAIEKINFHCNTAAASINTKVIRPYVFYGCAVPDQLDLHPNLVGHLYAIYLDNNGKFMNPFEYKVFKTSVRTKNPRSGYSAGIWNSGMGPTVMEDNNILISTGNGSIFPKEKNYGCSIVKIDGETLDVKNWSDFYSLDFYNFRECLISDLDFGASAVSYFKHFGNRYAAIIGKDGVLRLFNPDRMPQNDPRKMHEIKIGSYTYGQPLLYSQDSKHIRIAFQGRPVSETFEMSDYFLATDDSIKQIQSLKIINFPIKKIGCAGLIAKSGAQKDQVHLYYSGRVRKDFTLASSYSKLKKQLNNMFISIPEVYEKITGVFRSGYYKIPGISLGYLTGVNKLNDYHAQDIDFVVSRFYGIPRIGAILPQIPYDKLNLSSDMKILYRKNIGKVLTLKKSKKSNNLFDYCGELPSSAYTKLNLYFTRSQQFSALKEWVVGVYEADKTLRMKLIWKRRYNNDTRHPRSNTAAILSTDGGAIVTTPILSSFPNRSQLKLISLKDGEELATYQFDGTVRFSMPLIVGNKIFIATKKDGIKMFEIKKKVNLLTKFSFLAGFI